MTHYLKQFTFWNSMICPPLGIFLNLFFIWLVWRKTPKQMWLHSRILLQTCILDILFLLASTIGSAMAIGFKGGTIVFFDGYFLEPYQKLAGPFGLFSLYTFVFFLFSMEILSASVQFLYIYLVSNCNTKISLFHYLLMLSVPLAADAVLTIIFFIYNAPLANGIQENERQALFNATELDCEDDCFTLMKKGSLLFNVWTILLLLCFTASSSIIAVLGCRIILFVQKYSNFTKKLRRLNMELTINLIILAVFPLLLTLVELYIIDTSKRVNSYKIQFRQSFCMLGLWIPLFNPIVSILTNTPYRMAIVRLLWQKTDSQQVQPKLAWRME